MNLYIVKCSFPDQLDEVRRYYKEVNYQGGVELEDTVITAYLDNQLVGALRLCPETGYRVLRGMRVLPAYQRQGMGTKMLMTCCEYLADQVCYCIPWIYLRNFYGQAGFCQTNPQKAPPPLLERYRLYLEKKLDIIMMERKIGIKTFK